MLVVKENEGGLTPDMEKLKKDIQLFRKAASDYDLGDSRKRKIVWTAAGAVSPGAWICEI